MFAGKTSTILAAARDLFGSIYKERILDFIDSVKKLQEHFREVLNMKSITIPWKLHIVCIHLEENLTRMGQGLEIVCEQAGEAVHHKVKKTKARYIIVDI